ncbi:hypothetical protein PIB30_053548 [Stylosanthes scabra]|uniref:Uncharacterized protein n=1 Tax=Stylosanthes scabra TaxID=79078 RepID=A0ABU6ZHA9_9FABA|nr:hypothetical protein [Stylosanthes scabra]
MGDHGAGKGTAELSALTAAMIQLNATMADASKNLLQVLQGNVLGMKQVDIATGEMRRAISLVDACMAMVRKSHILTSPVVVVSDVMTSGAESQGAGNENTQRDPKGKAPVEYTSGVEIGDSGGCARSGRAPCLVGGYGDQTIMLGPMLHEDASRLFNTIHAPMNTLTGSRSSMGVAPYVPMCVGAPEKEHSTVDPQCPEAGHLDPLNVYTRKMARIGDPPNDLKTPGRMKRYPRQEKVKSGCSSKGETFPHFIRSHVNVTPEMNLKLEDVQYLAYIFGDSLNPNEKLFKRNDRKLDREDFTSLHTGNDPSCYFLDLMAEKTTWTQNQLSRCTVWSLPLLFSELCTSPDFEIAHVIDHFMQGWFPRPTDLKYIYVQMKEMLRPSKVEHYYLMAVEISCSKIWLFDCFPSNETADGRKDAAKTVAKVLDTVLRINFAKHEILSQKTPMDQWDIDFVPGIPNMNCCNRDKF